MTKNYLSPTSYSLQAAMHFNMLSHIYKCTNPAISQEYHKLSLGNIQQYRHENNWGIPEHTTMKVRQDNRPQSLIQATKGWNTNWNKHSIPYEQIVIVKNRDDIPSIDKPKFETTTMTKTWLADTEPVIAVMQNGKMRGYPLQILMWHEIVNDTFENIPLAVTYCPLCNSAFVFNRQLGGNILSFGTSGLLRFSNLIMYDRTTESLWQQFTGNSIAGDFTGAKLNFIPSNIVSFKDFWTNHPEGLILSRETGFFRNYGQNPYVNYDQIGNFPFLFQGKLDSRLPPMERVVGVWNNSRSIAYPFRLFNQQSVINDNINNLVIFSKRLMNSALDAQSIPNGKLINSMVVLSPFVNGTKLTFYSNDNFFMDYNTRSTWSIFGKALNGPLKGTQLKWLLNGIPFWFAWAAFYPNTAIYGRT